jgi:hypothetical protein
MRASTQRRIAVAPEVYSKGRWQTAPLGIGATLVGTGGEQIVEAGAVPTHCAASVTPSWSNRKAM